MPDASTPLNEDNVAEALQGIKDAQPQKKADIVQVFALRLDAGPDLSSTSIDAVTLSIPPLLASPSPALLTPVLFSLIPAQIKLVAENDPTPQKDRARLLVQTLLAPLLERMNDAKDRVHAPAVDNIIALGLAIYNSNRSGPESVSSDSTSNTLNKGKERETVQQMYERLLINTMEGKSPRGKVGGMKVVVGIREKSGALGLRPFMPLLAGYLEDGDSAVREGARTSLISLLSSPTTPLSARAELKKLMQSRNIKTTTIESLLDQINKAATSGSRPSPSRNASGASMAGKGAQSRVASNKSVGMMDDVEIPPVYISTQRELESEFASFLPAFEGKETEHNWIQRERAISRVRGMLVTGVHRQLQAAFISTLRSSFLSVSTKALASLRTTLSVLTIGMYNDLLEELGTAFDPLVDSILLPLAKLSGATKKITAENSQNTVGLIIKKTTCSPKTFIPFLSNGVHEKAPQVRGYYARHLKEYIEKHNGNRSPAWSVEHVNSVIEMLKHLLGDGTPAVRETARLAFWTLGVRYPNEATALMNGLDDGARKQLEKVKPAPSATPVESAAPHVATRVPPSAAATSVPAPTAAKERKPVSNMMAEMKRKKMAAMRALAASRSSNEDMLLPETDSNSTAPNSPLRPDSTPPVDSSRDVPSKSKPMSPPKNPRASLSRAVSSPQAETEVLPQSPARVPLPESPILIDLESKRNRQSSRVISPPAPAPNPFEDVFTAPASEAAGIDAIQADLASLRFAPDSSRNDADTRKTRRISQPTSPNVTKPDLPILPLALTVPEEARETTVGASHTKMVESTRGGASVPIVSELENGHPYNGETNRPIWNPAAQSHRTPPFTDCAVWLEAVRREEKRGFNQEEHDTAIVSHRKDIASGSVSSGALSDVFRGLVHVALERKGSIGNPTSVDHVRHLFDNDDASTSTTLVEKAAVDAIEVASQQLRRSPDTELADAYLLLLWQICMRHRHVCDQADHYVVSGLFALYQADETRMRRPAAALLALWGQMTPNIVGLLMNELSEAESFLQIGGQEQWKVLFFATMAVAVLVLRLPGAVLREQLPRMRNLIVSGMGASNIAARQAATVLIVAIQANIRDRAALFESLPGLTEQQKDLAAYMIKQDLPDLNEEAMEGASKVEGGLSKALRRLSSMRL